MPFFEHGNLKLYYEDVGKGEPILTNHGVMESCSYWNETGVTAKLAEKYRVISMDMRGHGKTVVNGRPYGYDVATMANDFGRLADYLGLDRFHILTHATGGMAGVRYAMTASKRLISLMLTDTGSATIPEIPGVDTEEMIGLQEWAEGVRNSTPEERIAHSRVEPGPFLFKMAEHPNNEAMWKIVDGFAHQGDPEAQAEFLLSFYSDRDPMVEGLRQINCPTLVLLGEFDIVFIRPSEIMAQEIPDVRHVVMEGIGHMTAIEDPDRTIKEILDFLDAVEKTGKANK
jgi:pimeloyl-ACP methyl ester carboxylesterase